MRERGARNLLGLRMDSAAVSQETPNIPLLFIGVANNVTGIDAMSPSSKDDFAEFEKLLKEKISSYEKSVHYSTFLESLFRDLCLSREFYVCSHPVILFT